MTRHIRFHVLMSVMASLCLPAGAALAQGCKPGERIEYKAQAWPEKWETGVCMRPLPGGTQVLVRQAPTQFYPEGFEKAYALSDVRPAGGAPPTAGVPAANTPAPATAPAAPQAKPMVQPKTAERTPQSVPAAQAGGTGVMSQQDILGFLQARLGNGDPFANPAREQVMQQLREEIMRRGVNFRYAAIGDFNNQLRKYGSITTVTAPIEQNFGPPARVSDLTGHWRMYQMGGPTLFTKGNETWRRMEYHGDAGALVVNAGGTYVWDSPSGMQKGQWRKATPAEMSGVDKGGEGIALIKAISGADYLVTRRTEEGPEGTGIMMRSLPEYGRRVRGVR